MIAAMGPSPSPSSLDAGLGEDVSTLLPVLGLLLVLGLVVVLWASTSNWRAERRIAREWRRMTDDERRQMRTRFVTTVYELSGRTTDAVRTSYIQKNARLGLQYARIRDNLEHSHWIKPCFVQAGLFRSMASSLTNADGTDPAVQLTAEGLRTLRRMDESNLNDLTIGETPETVVTAEGITKAVTNIFNAPVSGSQFNQGSGDGIQINSSDAREIAERLGSQFPNVLPATSIADLARALAEDGSTATTTLDTSQTGLWLQAIRHEIPGVTAAAVTATLKQLLGS